MAGVERSPKPESAWFLPRSTHLAQAHAGDQEDYPEVCPNMNEDRVSVVST